jgi:hypothetical protein
MLFLHITIRSARFIYASFVLLSPFADLFFFLCSRIYFVTQLFLIYFNCSSFLCPHISRSQMFTHKHSKAGHFITLHTFTRTLEHTNLPARILCLFPPDSRASDCSDLHLSISRLCINSINFMYKRLKLLSFIPNYYNHLVVFLFTCFKYKQHMSFSNGI